MERRLHWESGAERRVRTGTETMGMRDGSAPDASVWISTVKDLLLLSSSADNRVFCFWPAKEGQTY